MTVRNFDNQNKGSWDNKTLAGCFGDSKILPSDVDLLAGIRGHLVYYELKGIGVPLPRAQATLHAELREPKSVTVITARGTDNGANIQEVRLVTSKNGLEHDFESHDLDYVRQLTEAIYRKGIGK